jgi:hypothetical protein
MTRPPTSPTATAPSARPLETVVDKGCLIPLAAAWASHSGRLDPFLAGAGRFLEPVGRRLAPVGGWLVRHPVAGGMLSGVPWLGMAAVSVAKGLGGVAVVQVLAALGYGGMMVLNLRRARRQPEIERPTR